MDNAFPFFLHWWCLTTPLCAASPAKHGEGPSHGRAGGNQSQGGSDRSEGPHPQTQESARGEGVWTTVEGEWKPLSMPVQLPFKTMFVLLMKYPVGTRTPEY